MTTTKVNVGDKIVATRDQYYTVTKCTVMVVTKDMGDGDVCARIHDGDDNYSWFMPAGSYEPCGDTPTLWRDMTDAEKGALLLAKHEGKGIDFWWCGKWEDTNGDALFLDTCAYRVKHEPKIETVALCYRSDVGNVKNRIGTITLIDGIPDHASIRMASV